MSRDQDLRNNRLVFYEQDIDRLNTEIDSFLELSKARCVLLVDRDGHLVTRRGEPMKTSQEAISALIAGSFAATKEMARLLGESEFSILFHQAAGDISRTEDSPEPRAFWQVADVDAKFDGRHPGYQPLGGHDCRGKGIRCQ